MICIRCGHTNPGGMNFCQKCNAHLAKIPGMSGVASSIELEEGRTYLTPHRSYPTEYLYNLTCRAYDYIHMGASGDPLLEAYEIVRTRLEDFENNGMPRLIEGFEYEKQELPNDEYAVQMIYLLNKGVAMYHEGFDMMDGFIKSGEEKELIEAVTRLQEANDYLGLAGELAALRNQKIAEELQKMEAAQRLAAAQSGSAPPAGGPPISEPRPPKKQRLDSTQNV